MTAALVCTESGCPVTSEGECLEGFRPPVTCPHAREAEPTERPDDVVDPQEDADDLENGAEEPEDLPAQPWVALGGEVALTVAEAEAVAAQGSSRVVLVAGDFESGKTTLVVELYARFLQGPFAGAEFGGSMTLRALDLRHHPARESSGRAVPITERTQDEDMRLLHLRLRRHNRVQDLLLTDVKGEFFEAVADGSSSVQQVPLTPRADLCLLVVDGAAVRDRAERQTALSRARQLLGGLCEDGGLQAGTPVVIVLSKVDLLGDDDRAWAAEQLETLRSWAQRRGTPTHVLFAAARPSSGAAQGLDLLLDHLLSQPPPPAVPAVAPQPGDRQFWHQPEVSQ